MVLTAARQLLACTHVKQLKHVARMLTKQASTSGMSLEHAPLTIAYTVASLVVDVEG